jgi:hypothetical protein
VSGGKAPASAATGKSNDPAGARSGAADALRFLAVVSVVLFHIMQINFLQGWYCGGEGGLTYAASLVLTSVFDNRTIAFVSFFLSFHAYRQLAYGGFLRNRLARIGIPFVFWTGFYLIAGGLAPDGPATADIGAGDAALILFGGLAKYHLHFLPTLLVLCLLWDLYKWDLPLSAILLILLLFSAVRILGEDFLLGYVAELSNPVIFSLHVLKILDYLPVGLLAYWYHSNRGGFSAGAGLLHLAALAGLLGLSVYFQAPAHETASGSGEGETIWLASQALLSVSILHTSLFAVFALYPHAARMSVAAPKAVAAFYPYAFAVFLIHPFFIDIFLKLWGGAPCGIGLLTAVEFAFVFSLSLIAAILMTRIRYLRQVV